MRVWEFYVDGVVMTAVATLWLSLLPFIVLAIGLLCCVIYRQSIIRTIKHLKGLIRPENRPQGNYSNKHENNPKNTKNGSVNWRE